MTILTDPFPTIEQLPAIDAMVFNSAEARGNDDARQRAREAGRAEGFAHGYEDGKYAAEVEVRADIAFALTSLHGAIEDLNRRDQAGLRNLADEAIELAIAIAREVLGRELELSTSPALDALHRALEFAPDRGAVVARLNPTDLAAIGTGTLDGVGREVELVGDRSIERGGCVLEVGPARIDAQFETALGRVRSALAVASIADSELPSSMTHPAPTIVDPTVADGPFS